MTPFDTMKFENGLTAHIYHDADVQQPYSDDDALRIVVLHQRYIDPSNGACGRDPDEVAAWERENADQWFTIPLFLYDHSGTVYRAARSNPFHCPWDSGRVGIIALKRAEWGDGHQSDDWLAECAESIAEEYTNWANGECYGYVLHNQAGREIDSCWGFIGIQRVRDEATAVAASHDPSDVAQSWGLCCPRCGDPDEIDIAATVWVRLCPDGTDTALASNGDHEWSDDHAACCIACGFHAKVRDFDAGGKGGAS